jgi:hypothetical protein
MPIVVSNRTIERTPGFVRKRRTVPAGGLGSRSPDSTAFRWTSANDGLCWCAPAKLCPQIPLLNSGPESNMPYPHRGERMNRVFALFVLGLLGGDSASSQTTGAATILGNVTGTSGAVVPNAR